MLLYQRSCGKSRECRWDSSHLLLDISKAWQQPREGKRNFQLIISQEPKRADDSKVTMAQLLQWHWPLPARSKCLCVALPVCWEKGKEDYDSSPPPLPVYPLLKVLPMPQVGPGTDRVLPMLVAPGTIPPSGSGG